MTTVTSMTSIDHNRPSTKHRGTRQRVRAHPRRHCPAVRCKPALQRQRCLLPRHARTHMQLGKHQYVCAPAPSSSLAKSSMSMSPFVVTTEPHSFASIVYDVMTTEWAASDDGSVTFSLRLPWYSSTLTCCLESTCKHKADYVSRMNNSSAQQITGRIQTLIIFISDLTRFIISRCKHTLVLISSSHCVRSVVGATMSVPA
jgi:hypothetical protein